MKTNHRRSIGSLILERAVLASLMTGLLAFGWLLVTGWVLSPAMILIPVFVVIADTLFWGLLDYKREGVWMCVYLGGATFLALAALSLIIWMLPSGVSFNQAASIAAGYFTIRLCMMLVA